MKLAAAALLACSLIAADKPPRLEPVATRNDTIEAFGHTWSVPVKSDWALDGGVLKMLVQRPQEKPRRPSQFALAETKNWQKVVVEADVRPIGGSLIIVYNYAAPDRFDYAHLSVDDAAKVPVAHNGIFHVFGGDRVRISRPQGPPAFAKSGEWYHVRLAYDAVAGSVKVSVDGKENEAFEGVDKSIGAGKVGLGSFFETAEFRNVKISGTPAP
jgi:hypothetical protein